MKYIKCLLLAVVLVACQNSKAEVSQPETSVGGSVSHDPFDTNGGEGGATHTGVGNLVDESNEYVNTINTANCDGTFAMCSKWCNELSHMPENLENCFINCEFEHQQCSFPNLTIASGICSFTQ